MVVEPGRRLAACTCSRKRNARGGRGSESRLRPPNEASRLASFGPAPNRTMIAAPGARSADVAPFGITNRLSELSCACSASSPFRASIISGHSGWVVANAAFKRIPCSTYRLQSRPNAVGRHADPLHIASCDFRYGLISAVVANTPDGRSGANAEVTPSAGYVRFTPNFGNKAEWPFRPGSGQLQTLRTVTPMSGFRP